MMRWRTLLPQRHAWLILTVIAAGRAPGGENGAARLTFEQNVRPILKTHCFHCHGEEGKAKAGLDLRLARLIARGGKSGKSITAGRHEDSLIWERIDSDEMPPADKKLSPTEKETIARWIDQGALTAKPEPTSLGASDGPTDLERAFWSFQPIRRTEPPTVREAHRVRNPIDSFLLARLESVGLTFSVEADRRTLIRRATFDLTGLPPTPAEVAAFASDPHPDAYERLIGRLLSSPHYGERWARHWLDVAGYADSDGYTPKDLERGSAYKYRDYLVRAFNADRPWDELITEQLAGDELVKPPYEKLEGAELDKLVATGFLRMAPDGTGDPEANQPAARHEVLNETLKIVSSAILGLTVGCAQCHNHRYDPISQENYYRFRAIFEPALNPGNWRTPSERLISRWTDRERKAASEVDAKVARIEAEQAAAIEKLVQKVLERELAAAPPDLRGVLRQARTSAVKQRSEEHLRLLKLYPRVSVSAGNVSLYDAGAYSALTKDYGERIAKARATRPIEDFIQGLTEVPGQVPVTRVLFRGDINQPRQAVGPGEIGIVAAAMGAPPIPETTKNALTTGRRLAYARHLTSGKHPLVPRVLTNRIWHHHFGRGLVDTPSDFGALGGRPSHPELLDWLADEFVRGQWRLKHLHRLIMTSTAYRQSSRRSEARTMTDPDNRLLGRVSIRRLDGEAIRDAILAASGRLNTRMFGPPVRVGVDDTGEVVVGFGPLDPDGRPTKRSGPPTPDEDRRSLYVQVRRSLPLGILEVFDAPAMAPNCVRRTSSTVAPQSLSLMNSQFVLEQSESFAARIEAESGPDRRAQIRRAWQVALSRDPTPEQLGRALEFLGRQQGDIVASGLDGKDSNARRLALASVCQALLTSNAFLYLD